MKTSDDATNSANPPSDGTRIGWFRWVICGLLFLATTINYIDRQIIGVLKSTLSEHFHWNDVHYGYIITAFQVAYAAGYALGGRFMDWVGVRLGYTVAVVLWSLAAMAHAAAGSVTGFSAARFALGLSEGGNFPAAIKTVTEWFPRRQRALATGIFNSGSNVGALIVPVAVPWLTLKLGWQAAFLITGSLGFFWIVLWLALYRSPAEHSRVTPAELAFIRSDPPDPVVKIAWLDLLRHRQTWAYMLGTFCTSPIWWFYLYWIPDFLQKQHGLNLLKLGPPLVVIYLMTDVGSIGGGWLSSALIQRGWTVNAARKMAFLVCGLCVVPVFFASFVANLWVATLLIGLAASAHQGFSANLYTMVSDTVPQRVVSSVVGLGGMAGAIGGIIMAPTIGHILQWTHSYFIPFAIAATAYLVALGLIQMLLPRLEPMRFSAADSDSEPTRAS